MPPHSHITIIMTLVSRSTEDMCFEARLKDVSDVEMGLGLEKSCNFYTKLVKKHLMLERL